MNKKYYYQLFGYNVISEIDLGLSEKEFTKADVDIVLDGYIDQEKVYQEMMDIDILDDGVKVHMFGIAEFVIAQGKFISVKPYGLDYEARELALYLTGSIFAFILFQNKQFAIHGSAVSLDDEVVIITGNSGAGKSTLARGFIERGNKILSDDVSVLEIKDQCYIIPSYPSQKLWEDSSENFGIKTNDDQRIANRYNKFHIQIDDRFESDKKKLKAVVLIEVCDCKKVSIEKLNTKDALQLLINNTYGEHLIEAVNMYLEQFRIMTKVTALVDVYRLKRPVDVYTVNEQIEAVLRNINN